MSRLLRRDRTYHALVVATFTGVGLVLTGCFRSEMAVTVEDDGSGTTAIEVQFDEAALESAGITSDALDQAAETATRGIDGVEVAPVSADGARGFRVTIPFGDHRQLAQALTTGEYGGVSTRLFQSFWVVEGDEGQWSMDAVVDPAGFRATLSQIPAVLPGSPLLVDSDTSFVFAVTLPGEVVESNADSVDGGTARWELAGDTEAVTFTMENVPAGSSTLRWLLLGVGALLAVLLVVVLVRSKRRRRPTLDTRADLEMWAPPAPPPAPGPVVPPLVPVAAPPTGAMPVLPPAPPLPPGPSLQTPSSAPTAPPQTPPMPPRFTGDVPAQPDSESAGLDQSAHRT